MDKRDRRNRDSAQRGTDRRDRGRERDRSSRNTARDAQQRRSRSRRVEAVQSKPDKRANQTIMLRTLLLMAVFGVMFFVILLFRLYYIQINQHELYQKKAIDQQTIDNAVMANRGMILDTNGKVLARSATVYDVIISPRDFQALLKRWDDAFADNPDSEYYYPRPELEKVAAGLAGILEQDPAKIQKYFEKDTYYEVAAKRVEKEKADLIRAFIVENHLANSIQLSPTSKRYYPYGALAAQVIGWVNPNQDNVGAYGMEALYDDQLAGKTGRVVTAKKGDNTEMKYSFQDYYDATDGYVLNLTLDATIQYYCERVLAKGIEMFEVQNGGFAIAMDPRTGAILAWANSPNYDLNDPWGITDPILIQYLETVKNDPSAKEKAYATALGQVQNYQWRNKAINDTYEPGSTFKTVVLAAALEENVVNENDHFYCKGVLQVADRSIKCSKRDGHGDQDLAKAVANSCNPAFIMIGQKLGAEKFYDYLEDFGFLDMTGIDMQGEAKSYIWPREQFVAPNGITSLATASFGQRLKVTPIQLITAASAVVNGGHLMQPYVMKSISTADGDVVMHNEPTQVRQVVSERTAERCRTILESVVDGGTGKRAYVPGYRIGGKTGSSETGETDHTIVSFLGFAPANDPQVIILVAYDNPKPSGPNSNVTSKGYFISGGNMAAPMAGELMEDILEYIGEERVYTPEEQAKIDTIVPNLVGQPAQVGTESAQGAGFTVRTVGDGDVVTGQIPTGGAAIPRGSEVVLYLGAEKPTDQVTVPNIMGCTASQAQAELAKHGLYLKVAGSSSYMSADAVVGGQTIYAGTAVERGTVVECMFIDNTLRD